MYNFKANNKSQNLFYLQAYFYFNYNVHGWGFGHVFVVPEEAREATGSP